MATLNFQLDKRKNINGKYAVRLVVRHNRTQTSLATNVESGKSEWLKKSQRIKGDSPDNENLDAVMANYTSAVNHLRRNGHLDAMKAKDIVSYGKTYNRELSKDSRDFVEYWERCANHGKRPTTIESYKYALKSILAYNKEAQVDNFGFHSINQMWVKGYVQWLGTTGLNGTGGRQNTVWTKIRSLKAVINSAIDDDIISADVYKAFKKTKTYQERPIIFSLSKSQILELKTYDFGNPYTNLVRDMFLFSFYMIGMNLIDIYNLKKSCIKNSESGMRCIYIRSKTNKVANVPLCSAACDLINKFYSETGEYVFPFHDLYTSYESFYPTIRKRMKLIAEALDVPQMTFYTARDTWASIAGNQIGASATIIDRALTHSTKSLAENHYISTDQNGIDSLHFAVVKHIGISKIGLSSTSKKTNSPSHGQNVKIKEVVKPFRADRPLGLH